MIIKENTKEKITQPQKVVDLLNGAMSIEDEAGKDREHLYCLGLDTRNQLKYLELVGIGIQNQALISPKEILRNAVSRGVRGIIISHNHPSGNPIPSTEDLLVTRKLKEACEVLGIILYDHVIFTEDSFHSMKDVGDL